MKTFLPTILFVLAQCFVAHAGDKATGTESEKYFQRVIDSDDNLRQQWPVVEGEIRRLLTDGLENVKLSMATYIQQVPILELDSRKVRYLFVQLLDAAEIAERYSDGRLSNAPALDVSRTQNPEKARALMREILTSQVYVQNSPCLDHNKIPRDATTLNVPRTSYTCVYPRGLAALYLLNRSHKGISTPEIKGFVLSIFWHEIARKYDLDDEHELILPMEKEMHRKVLTFNQDCWIRGGKCELTSAAGDTFKSNNLTK